MRIVINACFGGFGLSHKATMKYAELKRMTLYAWLDDLVLKHCPDATFDDALFVSYATVPQEEYAKHNKLWHETPIDVRKDLGDGGYFCGRDIDRNDPALIEVIELMGDEANGKHASLRIVEIPDDVEWQIEEYDGSEHVAEKHRTWN